MQQQHTTLSQKIEIGAGIAFSVCLPTMVFLRHKMGYRFISLPRLLVIAAILFVIATFGAFLPIGRNIYILYIFVLAFVVFGLVERRFRWNDIKKGISWHSRSRGISWAAKVLPLSDSILKRYVDPAIVFVVGLLFAFIVQPLTGYYLLAAAVCMFAWESYDYQRSIDLMLDQLDNLIDSEVMSQNIDYYGQDGRPLAQRSLEDTAGIPTGISPELTAAIARKQYRASRQAASVATGGPAMQAGSPDLAAVGGAQLYQSPSPTVAPVAVAVEEDKVLPVPPAAPDATDVVAAPAEELPPTPTNKKAALDNLVMPDEGEPEKR
jgi:hypothetical protein